MEELEVGCPWTVTKGDSMDPDGEMSHKSDRKKAAKEEKENSRKLKDDESHKQRVLKKEAQKSDSCRIGRNPKLRLTIIAVTKRSDTGSLRRWWLKVEKLEQ